MGAVMEKWPPGGGGSERLRISETAAWSSVASPELLARLAEATRPADDTEKWTLSLKLPRPPR